MLSPSTKAKELLDESLDIEKDRLKVRKKHIRLLRRKFDHKTVARFAQIDNKITTAYEFEVSTVIPLVQ